MSQRIKNVDEEMLISLQVNVSLKSFSHHNGFKEGQIEKAKEEFKDEITKHLTNKLSDEWQMEEFLYSVDFVNYEVESIDKDDFLNAYLDEFAKFFNDKMEEFSMQCGVSEDLLNEFKEKKSKLFSKKVFIVK